MGTRLPVEISALTDQPTDAEVAEIVALAQVIEDEARPGDPRLSVAEFAGALRHPLLGHLTRTRIARVGGELVGRLEVLMDRRPLNAGFMDLDIEIHPDHRRQGIGTLLSRAAIDDAVDEGATSAMIWAWDERGRGFAESIGLRLRQEERRSRLVVADVDEAQQDEWIAAPRARDAGYRVVSWMGTAPAEHIEAWAVALDAMADAPLDEVEWNHQPITTDWVEAIERVKAARGEVRFASLALAPDGAAAGMSLILLHPDRPQFAHQEDTAVVPEHRGHGLGRWLKAANLRQARAAQPEIEIVETYNAESNGPMLDINVAMGFRPERTIFACQGSIEAVVLALDLKAG